MSTQKASHVLAVTAVGWILAVAAIAGGVGAGAVAAQTNTTNISDVGPYYANNSTSTPSGWLTERQDPTLVNVSALATRVGTFIIGSGPSTQGGGGPAGALVLGFVIFGVVGSILRGSGVGSVAGPVVLIAAAAAIVSIGLAPTWLFAVVLLGLGLVVTTVVLRAL
jgi:hypothetical protein